jgi:S1-C subfamily serine protease
MVVTQDADGKVVMTSGVVLTRGALVATNHHVVDGAKEILIQTSSGETFSGETFSTVSVIAVDAPRDLAILVVPGLHLTPQPLADSNTIEVGEDVLAIGNPEGLALTLSKGIVSGLRPQASVALDLPLDRSQRERFG